MTQEGSPQNITAADLERITCMLESIAGDSLILSNLNEEQRIRLLMAAGRVVHPAKAEVRRRIKTFRKARHEAKRDRDRELRANTKIRATRRDSVFVPPPRLIESDTGPKPEALLKPRDCYICKAEFSTLHHFYDSMCPKCAAFNYEKRFQTASLKGRTALITGSRVKIGFQAALMMLRAGAKVIVTTRFPRDAAQRYSQEPDFKEWGHRLQVHGLDLRHSPSVEAFTKFIDQTEPRLDIIINNAAQTVRRPPGFYAHMLELEAKAGDALTKDMQALLENHEKCKAALGATEETLRNEDGAQWISEWHTEKKSLQAPGVLNSARLSQIPYVCDDPTRDTTLFPKGQLDADLQQVDLRKMNSWRMTLSDVPTAELLEVQLVNSIAPFILCCKLKPLMLREPTGEKHIVNVSAIEGQFNRHTKTDKHPHTNMAKAALNMMTLTSARDYAKDGIFMNAVDTGWVTDEDPAEISLRKQKEHDFQPPLDIVDGAARIIDPIFTGLLTGKHSWGNFLKDYVPTAW